ncbi:hypothetical protein B0H16DRAFT_1762714 [Mycena metata]|uniref:Uncharacterized protein n=1 Tax=Mycena metata TaxID=1033252 RepID=A0AAD7MXJ2_9AGAR|nr:hypothetical protein B0H16DRAFT_1762714 [Mycena metata]
MSVGWQWSAKSEDMYQSSRFVSAVGAQHMSPHYGEKQGIRLRGRDHHPSTNTGDDGEWVQTSGSGEGAHLHESVRWSALAEREAVPGSAGAAHTHAHSSTGKNDAPGRERKEYARRKYAPLKNDGRKVNPYYLELVNSTETCRKGWNDEGDARHPEDGQERSSEWYRGLPPLAERTASPTAHSDARERHKAPPAWLQHPGPDMYTNAEWGAGMIGPDPPRRPRRRITQSAHRGRDSGRRHGLVVGLVVAGSYQHPRSMKMRRRDADGAPRPTRTLIAPWDERGEERTKKNRRGRSSPAVPGDAARKPGKERKGATKPTLKWYSRRRGDGSGCRREVLETGIQLRLRPVYALSQYPAMIAGREDEGAYTKRTS